MAQNSCQLIVASYHISITGFVTFQSQTGKGCLWIEHYLTFFLTKQSSHMNVQIQAVHFDADTKLTERVNQKLEKLRTFHDRIIDVEVYLILDNVAHKLKDKIAEIKVHVPRHSFFVKHQSKTFEESFDFAFDSLVNQIKRYKERRAASPVQVPE